MNAASLDRLIQHPVINNDPVLISRLRAADTIDECVLVVPDYFNMTLEHVGAGMEKLSGYRCRDWMAGGIPLFAARTPTTHRSRLAALQSSYTRQAKSQGFNPQTITLQEYQWILHRRNGQDVAVNGLGVILNYTAEMDFQLGVGFIVPNTSQTHARLERCRSLLVQIKKRHNAVYNHAASVAVTTGNPVLYQNGVSSAITVRQREVLRLLAQGLSTKQIADQLKISIHTVESHRKSLLEKFGARNVAELIMKASKTFWFE